MAETWANFAGRRPAPGAVRHPGPGRPGDGAARRGPDRPLGPGTRLPSSRALAADLRHRPQHRGRGLQPAGRGGLADRADRLGHLGSPTAGPPIAGPAPAPVPRPAAPSLRPARRAPRTCPRSRARPGWPRPAGRWPPRRPSARTTPTRAACRSCGAALAGYLARARGVAADPGRIVICAGFAHGLALACAGAAAAGAAHARRRRPTGTRPTATSLGRGACACGRCRSTASGAVRRRARTAADAALLTPAHQFPLGVTLHPRRRRAAGPRGGGTGDRGRLRRRVPLRPAAGRRPAGARARSRRLRGHGEQEPGPGAAAGLAGRSRRGCWTRWSRPSCPPGRTRRPRPAHPGRVHRRRRLRPARPPRPAGLPAPPRPAGRRAGPRRHARSPGSPPACTRSSNCPARLTNGSSSPAPPGTAWPCRAWTASVRGAATMPGGPGHRLRPAARARLHHGPGPALRGPGR